MKKSEKTSKRAVALGLTAGLVGGGAAGLVLGVPGLTSAAGGDASGSASGGNWIPLSAIGELELLAGRPAEARRWLDSSRDLYETLEVAVEGCLSLPGMVGKVPRYRRIRYRGLTLSGALLEREAEGFHAVVFQHEYDHLDGILYTDRLSDPKMFGFVDELAAAETDD